MALVGGIKKDISSAADSKGNGNLVNRLKGKKIRDEFLCPITYELLRDPVVASDGHTYEKVAIEKWMRANKTSPRSGEEITADLIPNYNIRKMIHDIIEEGGEAFYTIDVGNKEREVDIRSEKLLIMECLGPSESEWYNMNFQVTGHGCVGGRKYQQQENAINTKDAILFKDVTVSRKHFEISRKTELSTGEQTFYIRDMGSAGGTFVRLNNGQKKQLHIGMIILLGKHQFTVSSMDDLHPDADGKRESATASVAGAVESDNRDCPRTPNAAGYSKRDGDLRNCVQDIVNNAKRLMEDMDGDAELREDEALKSKLESLTLQLSPHIPRVGEMKGNSSDGASASRDHHHHHQSFLQKAGTLNQVDFTHEKGDRDEEYGNDNDSGTGHSSIPSDTAVVAAAAAARYSHRRCVLTCCAPDGSPLQGHSFILGRNGAVLGRKSTCDVQLFVKQLVPGVTVDEKPVEQIVHVDSAISSEHARIEFDEQKGAFLIVDGSKTKPSTNGTWIRLSGPHQASSEHELHVGDEVLIGTVRFQAKESKTISEYAVDRDRLLLSPGAKDTAASHSAATLKDVQGK